MNVLKTIFTKQARRFSLVLAFSLASMLSLAACGTTPTPTATLDLQPLVEDIVQATLSAIPANIPIPTATELLPTSTPTLPAPTATNTSQPPTATFVPDDPAVTLGQPYYVDNFNNSNNWTLFDDECFKSEITDGKYVMSNTGSIGFACWEMTALKAKDFYLQTLVNMPETCQANDRFGMIFRAPDLDRGYLVGLTCDGRFFLYKWDGEETTNLIKPGGNSAILVGAGQVNRLGVKASAGGYAVYINGVLIGTAEDNQYLEDGLIGYFVTSGAKQPFSVKFDDLSVWRLPK